MKLSRGELKAVLYNLDLYLGKFDMTIFNKNPTSYT